jgi:hypothetical protein
MIDINQYVSDYLRDAQWRTSELSIQMDEIKDDGNTGFKRRDTQRLQLSVFMDLLYVTDYSFKEGYNFLYAGDEPWTDAEIQAEIDYLRSIGEMSEVPFLTFADYQLNVLGNVVDNGTVIIGFPAGNQGDFLYYANTGNSPIPTPFPDVAGHTTETIDAYFANRI